MKIHLNISLNLPKKGREKGKNHRGGLLKLLANLLRLCVSFTFLDAIAMSERRELTLVTFQVHQGEFEFLGIENKLTEQSNFGQFWNDFFKLGGYDNIDPYAVDPKDTNVWYVNKAGEKIYFQGKMVKNVEKIAEGYSLVKFPASDYLVLTHEWLPTFKEAQRYGIGFGRKHMETVQLPDGYTRYDDSDFPIIEIERDNENAPDGSRIEHWLPIKKTD